MSVVPESLLLATEQRIGELKDIIANALKALDEGRYGDVRRILTGVGDKGVMTKTGVIAKDGG